MALLTCRECKHAVSSDAKTCPNCGAKVWPPKVPIPRGVKALLWIFGIVILVSTIAQRDRRQDVGAAKEQSVAAAMPDQSAKEKTANSTRPSINLICGRGVSGFRDATMEFDVGGTNVVNVTFLAKRPSKADVDRAVRECLAQGVKEDGTRDIIGNAFYRAREGNNPDEDEMLNPYGFLASLVYVASDRTIGLHKAEEVNPANASRGAKLEGAARGALYVAGR